MPVNFDNILQRAANLMSEENLRKMDSIAAAYSGKSSGGSGGGFSDFEAQAGFGFSKPTPQPAQQQLVESKPTYVSQSEYNDRLENLPEFLKESFAKNVPYGYNVQETPPAYMYGSPQVVNEQQVPKQQAPQQYSAQGGVNYDTIKYIVNECIKENMKGMLTEGNGTKATGFGIYPGNKVRFYDSKGNIYEGVFKLVKKANQ